MLLPWNIPSWDFNKHSSCEIWNERLDVSTKYAAVTYYPCPCLANHSNNLRHWMSWVTDTNYESVGKSV
jgi:hypothetical protein